MKKYDPLIQQILSGGLVPLFYHANEETCLQVVKALYAAGIRAIEFTNRGAHAKENFKSLVALRKASMPDLLLGVGTIKSPQDLQEFSEAGADFLISPYFDVAISAAAKEKDLLWIPGCMTPTEIHVAENSGCKLIKLFPGDTLQPAYIKSILPLFPGLQFMVTGGVQANTESLRDWFGAGASCVGMGSQLITKQILDKADFIRLRDDTANLLDIIKTLR